MFLVALIFKNNDEALKKLLKKNSAKVKEAKDLKIEQETQSITLHEEIKQKKKAMEEKLMVEEEKRMMARRLEKRSIEVQKIINN